MWTNGWRLSAFAAVRSGFPYTVPNRDLAACDATGVPSTWLLLQPRPDRVAGILVEMSPAPVIGGSKVVNRAAFCFPGMNVPGTLGRNFLSGPGFWNADLSLARAVHLTEDVSLTFRADFFNAFNHANLGHPSFDIPNEFGVSVTTAWARRENFRPLHRWPKVRDRFSSV